MSCVEIFQLKELNFFVHLHCSMLLLLLLLLLLEFGLSLSEHKVT